MKQKQKYFELKGKWVVLLILVLTGIVGGFFIALGPRATAKRPCVLHVGLRYENEQTIDFLRYGKDGPAATLELLRLPEGDIALRMENLRLGRNLVPVDDLRTGRYRVRLTAAGFRTVELPVRIEGRLLRPVETFDPGPGRLVDTNVIGVRFEVADQSKPAR